MRVILIFVDGVGLGSQDDNNPFVFTPTPGLSGLLAGKMLTREAKDYAGPEATLLGIDATLGVPGLPQSATGQTALFTGVNAPACLGDHLRGFPNSALRKIIAENSMFKQLKKEGFEVAFTNAYRPPFFDLLRHGLPGNRYSCSTLTTYYGDLPFFRLKDIKDGKALYMDITNEILNRLGYDVPLFTPEEGAERLFEISREYDFCLFEYFLSDLAGHLSDQAEASRVISTLDRFIGGLAKLIDPGNEMIVVVSDHGNLEDINSENHTLNEAMLLLIGDSCRRSRLNIRLSSLTDVLPAIKELLYI